jgi:trypsin
MSQAHKSEELAGGSRERHGEATLVAIIALVLLALAAAAIPPIASASGPFGRWRPIRGRSAHELRALRIASHRAQRHHIVPVPHYVRPSAAVWPEIVGGTSAKQGTFGYMAFIIHYNAQGNADFLCSGTVLSDNVVMTAGHCAANETTGVPLAPGGFVVVTGAVNWTDKMNRELSNVSRVIVDPSFNPTTGANDAALLVLSTGTTAPAIGLATSADQVLEQPGEGVAIAGWGETYAGEQTLVSVLQYALAVVQSPAYCAQFNPLYLSSVELCAVNYPDDDTATCNGDSGGPLIALDPSNNLVEIGITSRGPTNCNTTTADYFTTVRPLSGWANSWIHAVARPVPISYMTLAAAGSYVNQTLHGVLGSPFAARQSYKTTCTRNSVSQVTCSFTFTSSSNYYYGHVTVYYIRSAGQIYWTDSYLIHWVNNYCYFHSGHRSTCQIHTKSGSF